MVPDSLVLRILDLVRVLKVISEKYEVSFDNVHLFLDEVSSLGQDWTFFDKFSSKYDNVVWLALNSEFHIELDDSKVLALDSFETRNLDHVLRNTKLICLLSNEVRKFVLECSNFEQKMSTAFDIKHHFASPGHSVDGLIPRMILLPKCSCTIDMRYACLLYTSPSPRD